MHYNLDWNPENLEFIICILVLATCFIAFFFLSKSDYLENAWKNKFGIECSKVWWIVFQRLLGFISLGLLPLLTIFLIFGSDISNYGVAFDNFVLSMYWIIGLSALLVVVNYFNHKKEDNLAMYPQIRKNEWNIQLLLISAISWILYLLAYEFMFRGYLLFVSVRYLGVWPAISLNVAIYSLVHMPKGIKETLGALPLGIVLGIVTIQTGNIWVAFVVHVVLALSNEWFSLKAHPKMKFMIK